MIRKEDFAVITALHQRGVFLKDIALEVGGSSPNGASGA